MKRATTDKEIERLRFEFMKRSAGYEYFLKYITGKKKPKSIEGMLTKRQLNAIKGLTSAPDEVAFILSTWLQYHNIYFNGFDQMWALLQERKAELKKAGKWRTVTVFNYREEVLQDFDAVVADMKKKKKRFSILKLREALAITAGRDEMAIHIRVIPRSVTPEGITEEIKQTANIIRVQIKTARFDKDVLERCLWVYDQREQNREWTDILPDYKKRWKKPARQSGQKVTDSGLLRQARRDLVRAVEIIRNIESGKLLWWIVELDSEKGTN